MTLFSKPPTPPDAPLSDAPPAADPFAAATYTDWVRASLRAREGRPDACILFDSTIREPTEDLFAAVRNVATPGGARYVSVFDGGNPFAVAAVAARYGLEPRQIIPTTGTTTAMIMALKALVAPGDEVLVESPGFDLLAQIARDAGAEVTPLARTAPVFEIDLDDLDRKLTRRTKAVVVTNLHNPSGHWMTPAKVQAVAGRAARVGAALIVDEVYADFAKAVDDANPLAGRTAAGLADNILCASSLTKVFGLFSLKYGWLSGDAELIARVRAAWPDGDIGVSKLSHAVAAEVLEHPRPFDAHWAAVLDASRPVLARHADALVAEGLLSGEVPPLGCMYFPRLTGVADTAAFCTVLWERQGVLLAPGEYFDAPGHVRIGFGCDPAEIEHGMGKLGEALRDLRRSGA